MVRSDRDISSPCRGVHGDSTHCRGIDVRDPNGGARPIALLDAGGRPDSFTTDTEVYGLLPVADSPDSIVAWAEDYCEAASLSPCTGIADRAVAICIENRDCHPAVLVPFDEGTAAFLFGGNFQDSQVIAVWRFRVRP